MRRRSPADLGIGWLSGEEDAHLTPAAPLLEDLQVIFSQADVVKLSTEQILDLLAELRPAVYGNWSAEALAAGLRPHGVMLGQGWVDDGNPQGLQG